MIVAEDAYEVAEPTIDSHIVKMKSLDADVFFDVTTPKFAAQAIKKAAEIGWKPMHVLNSVATSIGAVIKPAGFSVAYLMDALDPQWKDDPDMKAFDEFLARDFPKAIGPTVCWSQASMWPRCGGRARCFAGRKC